MRLFSSFLLLFACAACNQSGLSGGNSLPGAKGKEKDKDKNESKDSPDEKADKDEKSEEGTDVPVWVNASYLTCAEDKEHTEEEKVALVCGLDDEAGDDFKVPDGTTVAWVALDEDGKETDDKNEETDNDGRTEARFYFPKGVAAQRSVGVKFDGKDLTPGKTVKIADAVPELAEEPLDVSKGLRLFVLSTPIDGSMGGFTVADTLCQSGATAGDLAGNFRALLSGTGRNAFDLIAADRPILYRDGTVLAANRDALFADGKAFSKPLQSENGGVLETVPVFTGSNGAGKASGGNCENWTSADSGTGQSNTASSGQASVTDRWFASIFTPCGNLARLYCIQTVAAP